MGHFTLYVHSPEGDTALPRDTAFIHSWGAQVCVFSRTQCLMPPLPRPPDIYRRAGAGVASGRHAWFCRSVHLRVRLSHKIIRFRPTLICNRPMPAVPKTADIDIAMSVCPSVCPSRSGTVSKRLNTSSQVLHHTVVQSFQFYEYQIPSRNSDGVPPPPAGALNTGGV